MRLNKYFIFPLILLVLLFSSCTNPINKQKANKYYYTNEVSKHLTLDKNISGSIIDTNFYKEIELSKDSITTIKDFIDNLKKDNFIDLPKTLPAKPKYKFYLNFNKEKYVINIYTEKYISIYPWDGDYVMDYIDMTGVYLNYNLYGLCINTFPQR
ncbi:MAG: DUF4883 family protein [Clostridiaceae bacterium]|nr:DUF4883 family protein [Clostridiaceae bacterium]